MNTTLITVLAILLVIQTYRLRKLRKAYKRSAEECQHVVDKLDFISNEYDIEKIAHMLTKSNLRKAMKAYCNAANAQSRFAVENRNIKSAILIRSNEFNALN